MTYDLTYLSLGGGRQSSAMLAMACNGDYGVPKPDVAIFADTQAEIADTYAHIQFLTTWAAMRGVKVITATAGSLEKVALMQENAPGRPDANPYYISIPVFTAAGPSKVVKYLNDDGEEYEWTIVDKGGRLRRQCTKEFKLNVLKATVRQLLGFQKGERIAGKKMARALIGISLDETVRVKPSAIPWAENVHPLVDARLTVDDCVKYLNKVGIPIPPKSACYFCPYHDDRYWQWLRDQQPAEWKKAVTFDLDIRNMTRAGVDRPVFLHRSMQPLGEVDIDARVKDQDEKQAIKKSQLDLFGGGFTEECEGICGV